MKIAIIGLANSGKTTVFNALTRGTAETTSYASGQLEPNIATVKVPDQRLNVLAQMFDPKKNTPADVQYVDVGGLSSGARQSGGLPPALLNYIGGADALLHVARAFEDEGVAHPEGSVNLARDIESVDLELAFSDMAIIERRLAKLNAEIGKTASKDRELRIAERDLLVDAAERAGGWQAHPRCRAERRAGTAAARLPVSDRQAYTASNQHQRGPAQ